jgi:hypothetical protein
MVQSFGPLDKQTGMDNRGRTGDFLGTQEIREQMGGHF